MHTPISRRHALAAIPASIAIAHTARAADTPPVGEESVVYADFPSHNPELVREIVGASHGRFDRVKELVTQQPALARAAWDWGFGDWESALGAASHVGNRDIAELLIQHGARPDIFTFAMLGNLPAVRAAIEANPAIAAIHGPHGFSLFHHAAVGGDQSKPVADYLSTIKGADRRATSLPISEEEQQSLLGEYIFSPAPQDRFIVNLNRRGILTIQRVDKIARAINRVDPAYIFAPTGAEQVRISFQMQGSTATSLTIHDPNPICTATRI